MTKRGKVTVRDSMGLQRIRKFMLVKQTDNSVIGGRLRGLTIRKAYIPELDPDQAVDSIDLKRNFLIFYREFENVSGFIDTSSIFTLKVTSNKVIVLLK